MKKAILNKYELNGYTVHSNLPIGAPMAWLSDNLPVGFLAFDGSEYNISDYPELYNVVKNIPSFHSETEGKFKIPNLKGRVLQGADTVIGELIEAGLPNITGKVFVSVPKDAEGLGAIEIEDGQVGYAGGTYTWKSFKFNANKGETKTDGTLKGADEPHVYGNSDTVQPNAFTVRWIIKATQYASVEQNAIDDTKATVANTWSAEKINNELGFEIGSNENGYYKKWVNGLLECWGTNTDGSKTTINLPIAYKDNDYSIMITTNAETAQSTNYTNPTPTSFGLGNLNGYFICKWRTIGFWK